MKTVSPEIKQVKESILSVKKGCIFLVDDNSVFLSILENEIRSIFPLAQIESYTSGEEALKNLSRNNPFLVFLDYNLAGPSTTIMNGISVLKKIKQETPSTEVVMLSGVDDIKIITTSMKHGAFNYILKGEQYMNNIRREVINILRKMRIKEESKGNKKMANVLQWIAMGIVLVLVVLIYFHYRKFQ